MVTLACQRAVGFRKIHHDDGLLGYIEHEFESIGWTCSGAIQIIDGLVDIDDKDPERVRLSTRDKITRLLLEEIRTDQANSEVVNLLNIAVAFSVGVFSMQMFEINVITTVLVILATALVLLTFIHGRAARTNRARKTEDVLTLIQAQTCLQLQRLDNAERARRQEKQQKR